YDGIDLEQPHLKRKLLVDRLVDYCCISKFVPLIAPPGSGKTSLLALFADRVDIECIYISCDTKGHNLSRLLMPHGIDLENQSVTGDRPRVIMLDDAQNTYLDYDSWVILVKVVSRYIPQTRFIIAATHSLKGGYDSGVEFNSFPMLRRHDLLLSDGESTQLLMCDDRDLGLAEHLQFDGLVRIISSECNGLISALRKPYREYIDTVLLIR
ncbi:hypothetical protein O9G_005917, partial [Rozella allomycis CSF55]